MDINSQIWKEDFLRTQINFPVWCIFMGSDSNLETHEDLSSSNWYGPIVYFCVIQKGEIDSILQHKCWFMKPILVTHFWFSRHEFTQLKKVPTN